MSVIIVQSICSCFFNTKLNRLCSFKTSNRKPVCRLLSEACRFCELLISVFNLNGDLRRGAGDEAACGVDGEVGR